MNVNKIIDELNEDLSENIDIMKDYTDDEIEDIIEKSVFEKSKNVYLDIADKNKIIQTIFNSRRRLDILQPLLDDCSITEIMVNGPDNIFIEKHGCIKKTELRFKDEEKLYTLIQSIVAGVNRRVNESSPIVDARLEDGSRISIVLPPIALNGPVLTIRKFPLNPYTMDKLTETESITEEAASLLDTLVKARYNIFICGGTGSGKTTYLNALSCYIPSNERIVTIEDSAELQIKNIDNLVKLETRNPNTEGKGEVSIRELIRTSLRMRPDRIIVGEVRGPEALDMLQAMNTGHDGSLSTGHANSTKDMLTRLETMVLCGALLPLDAIRQQIASALDIIVHLGRLRDMSRKVLEINEVKECTNGRIITNPLFIYRETGESTQNRVKGRLFKTDNKLINDTKLKMAGFNLN